MFVYLGDGKIFEKMAQKNYIYWILLKNLRRQYPRIKVAKFAIVRLLEEKS